MGAFFLAPVPAAVLGATVSFATGAYPRPDALAFFYLLALYAFQLLFGLPLAALLLKARKANAIGFALAGALMVAIPAIPYVIWSVGKHPDLRGLAPFVLGLWLAMGGLTGLTAWLLGAAGKAPPPPPDENRLRGTFS